MARPKESPTEPPKDVLLKWDISIKCWRYMGSTDDVTERGEYLLYEPAGKVRIVNTRSVEKVNEGESS